MRTLPQMKRDRNILINHEFYRRIGLSKLMRYEAEEIQRKLKRFSNIDYLIRFRKYRKMEKQLNLCIAIADRLLDEARTWNYEHQE